MIEQETRIHYTAVIKFGYVPVLYCKYDARAHKLFQSKYIKIQEPRLSLSSGEDFKFNASLVQSKAPLP